MAQTMMQKIYSKMTPKQKNSPEIQAWLKGRPKASGRPSLAKNTGEPTNVRKKRPGGYATGGRTKKRAGGGVDSDVQRTPKPGDGYVWDGSSWIKKPKKQRGYGQASDGRTRKAHGGSVSSRLSKAGPVAKPN